VGEASADAGLGGKHGDKLGPCPAGAAPAPPAAGTATLTVIKHVVNNNGGTKTAGDFTLTTSGVTASGGNSFAGSETGVTKTITFGSYNLTESAVGYAQTGASGCSGTITTGEQKTCTITNDDVPATLTVIKHVVNDNGKSKTAGEFTLTITGVTASDGNSFAGSESASPRRSSASARTASARLPSWATC
jgi:large repetitive protein